MAMRKDRPIEYTLMLQRVLVLTTAASFFALSVLLIITDPYTNSWLIWLFWLLSLIFLTGLQSFVFFWWQFFIRKNLLNVPQVSAILYRSLFGSALLVYLGVNFQTLQLNSFLIWLVVVIYLLYLLFMRLG